MKNVYGVSMARLLKSSINGRTLAARDNKIVLKSLFLMKLMLKKMVIKLILFVIVFSALYYVFHRNYIMKWNMIALSLHTHRIGFSFSHCAAG